MKREILSWIFVVVVGFLLAMFVTKVLIIKCVIPSGSMENTIMTGDRMIGNRLAYLFSEPKHGDIIIFKAPDEPDKDYVKRIIGIPGDTVTIKNGQVYVNDLPLIEDYIKEPMIQEPEQTYVVPEDSYFVMGDNRNSSLDSRYWTSTNFVKKDAIVGKAWFKYRPTLKLLK